ncbi:MAG TPA: polyphosphate kinase 2 [Desulfurivibrio alkaliphilus]|uniref:ADP/GDP-polyphosphate phosphotransferase n=1 Tax=Desulfurivibrio alkaliphilus TaxID=427923 RepID=A0A7C2XQZ0_9BACT|nr:polyphosphate kinase 2 [Desulfurivibrio alkaliphilus]
MAKKEKKKHREEAAEPKKHNPTLNEMTALKNKDKGNGKKLTACQREVWDDKRRAVWVKHETLAYEKELIKLQIELLKYQAHIKRQGMRVIILFEGRDAAGKGGTIQRIMQHLNPRGARVVALEKPSDTERTQWYFQRYISEFPHAGEIVLFDRSWYNRAMVEPVMGFCTDEENKRFLKDVPLLERMLVKDGIMLIKLFFSVDKQEQLRRLSARQTDPLKFYKISPVDMQAQELWDSYTVRKFQMLSETNRSLSPWTIIRSNNKKRARLNCIKYILSQVDYAEKLPVEELTVDPKIVISGIDELRYMEENLMSGNTLPG